MEATLTRIFENDKQTIGILTIAGETFCTLELPDKQNQPRVSRIPAAVYPVRFRNGVEEGSKVAAYEHYHVQDVPGRSWILIHAGNFYSQIRGCILIGDGFAFIDKDEQLDVTNSRAALKELLRVAPSGFVLNIIDKHHEAV